MNCPYYIKKVGFWKGHWLVKLYLFESLVCKAGLYQSIFPNLAGKSFNFAGRTICTAAARCVAVILCKPSEFHHVSWLSLFTFEHSVGLSSRSCVPTSSTSIWSSEHGIPNGVGKCWACAIVGGSGQYELVWDRRSFFPRRAHRQSLLHGSPLEWNGD